MANRIAVPVLRRQTSVGIQDTCTFKLAELLRLTDPESQEGRAAPCTHLVLGLSGGQARFTALSVLPSPGIAESLEPCAGVLTLDGEAQFRVVQGAQALTQLRSAHRDDLSLGALSIPVLLLHPQEGARHL